jgi:hypothetical protein
LAAKNDVIKSNSSKPSSFRRLRIRPKMPKGKIANATPVDQKPLEWLAIFVLCALFVVVVYFVDATVTVKAPGAAEVAITEAGETTHVASVGAPEQVNEIGKESLVDAPPVAATCNE